MTVYGERLTVIDTYWYTIYYLWLDSRLTDILIMSYQPQRQFKMMSLDSLPSKVKVKTDLILTNLDRGDFDTICQLAKQCFSTFSPVELNVMGDFVFELGYRAVGNALKNKDIGFFQG